LETKQHTLTKKEIKIQYQKFIGRKIFFTFFLLALIILIAGISASLGSANLSLGETYSAVLHRFFPAYFASSSLADVCMWNLRLPRVFMGIVAGFGLGIAGCVTQAILKNPLASPYTLGISSGAGFGASLAILTGAGIFGGNYLVIGNAFLFSLLCSFIILGLSNRKGATPETMILAGIAMMYLFSAMTTILQYFGEAEAVKEAVFWTIGDLDRSSWPKVTIIAGMLACCFPLLMIKSLDLNLMAAGDETAASLGVNVKSTRIILMGVTTLLVACIVCFTGTIGFIGLVAPHLTRITIGGDNRFVLPVSGLFGTLLLISADLIARRILAPIILPVGAITAFMGAPLFLYMIMKRKREYW
jgi:iron complex transport system permease protein